VKMTQERPPVTQAQVDGFWDKLQTFYEGLPPDEQWLLAALVQGASAGAGESEVAGHALTDRRPSDLSAPPPPRLPKLPFSFFRPFF
jgi:hypothetical protein